MTNNISDVFEDEGMDRPEDYITPTQLESPSEGIVGIDSTPPLPRPTQSPTPSTEAVQSNQIGDVFADEGVDRPVDDLNEEHQALTLDEIKANPLKMTGIRSYLIDRLGKQWENKPDDEVLDTFMSRMRFMNTNEVRTLSEARYIQYANDEQKNKAATAYSIYDEIAPMWDNGDALGATWDYTKAVLSSPSTYIGGVIGKGVVGATAKAGAQAVQIAARQAFRTGGVDAAKAVLVGAARKQVATEIGIATGVDTALSTAQEAGNQSIRMDVGLQDEYDVGQLAIAAASGLVGGGVAYIPEMRHGTLGFDPTQLKKLTNANAKNILSGSAKKLTVKNTPDDPEYARYVASLWRRMLVSHPATTAVNVQGWGIAHFARTMAEVVDGGMVGTAGMIGNTLGAKWAPDALADSKALMQNTKFKLQMLMDPYGSRSAFDALLSRAPKKVQEDILAEAFGGIGQTNMVDKYGIHKAPDAVKGVVRGAEKVADLAAAASFIKVQDVYTKTFSALGELDRLSRLRLNKGLDDIVNTGSWNDITDEMWHEALSTMTVDTFSKDYTKGRQALNRVADLVEKVSDTPYIGFLFPFGRFMNNTIAYTYQYSPLGFLKIASAMKKGGSLREQGAKALLPSNSDLGMDLSKAIVGSVALWEAIDYSQKAREEGFNWFDHEDSTGQVTTQQNLAPLSTLKVLARIGDHIKNGNSVPPELFAELGDNLGPLQWARETSGNNPLVAVTDWLSREQNPETQGQWMQLGSEFLAGISGQVVTGFTRPLDPLNKLVGASTESDYAIDRRLAKGGGEKIVQELTRYTDNIFDAITGGDIKENPLRQATRPEGDIRDPNPGGSLLGRKELPAKNYIDVILAKVDLPSFLFNQRSNNPEADNFMNTMVGPVLNMKSQALLKDDIFKKASSAVQRDMVMSMLDNAREEIKTRLSEGLIGDGEDRLSAARRTWVNGTSQAIRDEARKDLEISTPDRDLSEQELTTLKYYTGQLKELYKNRSD